MPATKKPAQAQPAKPAQAQPAMPKPGKKGK
jgi:hypothetical protein